MDLATMIATQVVSERKVTLADYDAACRSHDHILRRDIEKRVEGLTPAPLGDIISTISTTRLQDCNGPLGNDEHYRNRSGLGLLHTLATAAVLGKIKDLVNNVTQVGRVKVHHQN